MDHPFRGLGGLFLLLFCFLSGVFLGLLAGTAAGAASGILLVASAALLFLRAGPVPVACAVAALCGGLTSQRLPLLAPEAVLPYTGVEVVLEGRVPEIRATDGGWSGAAEEAVVSLPGTASSLRIGTVLFHVRNPESAVSFPSRLRAVGRLHAARGLGNPGEIPRELSAMAAGAQYAFSADAGKAVFLPLPRGERTVLDRFARARGRTGEWVRRHAGESNGSLYLLSLATGEVPPYSHPMVGLLRRTGLAHLLAISGVNVAVFHILAVASLRLGIWVVRRRHGTPDLNRLPPLLSLPACWAYVLLAGAPTPAVRSAGMITLSVIGWNRLGTRAPGIAWSFMLCLTVVASPLSMLSSSFLLSYGATFHLIANGTVPAGCGAEGGDGGWIGRALRWGGEAARASAVAFLGTLPVSGAFFQAVPAGAILWNVLFGPVLGAAGVAGASLAVAGGAFGLDILGPPVRLASEGLTLALRLLDAASGSGAGYFAIPPAGIGAAAACTMAGFAGTLRLLRSGMRPWPAAAASSALFLLWAHLPFLALPAPGFSFTAMNVGKGASHLAAFPDGRKMLIDCGSALRGDAGVRAVVPFLRGSGIRRIDVLVLTHPHEDHYGGADAVLSAFPVGEIWIPEGSPPEAFGPAVRIFRGKVRFLRSGDRERFGGVDVLVRAPKAGAEGKTNERGIALEFRFGILSLWLPADLEGGPSRWGTPQPEAGDTRVLLLPHHGSPGAAPAEWMAFCRPAATVGQNGDCFTGGNLVLSGQRFLLENGAFTVRSGGKGATFEQGGLRGALRLLWRLT
ncbi:MAG TPA: ComEC/Rec2 family competence protein [Candidatus Deferrimicrobiaceae bacterium]